MRVVSRQCRSLEIPLKMVTLFMTEVRELFLLLIINWPNTSLGFRARRFYWRRKTGVCNIRIARGAKLRGCESIVFGDNIEIGENSDFVVGGTDGHKIFIGSNIAFARGVYLRSANHRFDDPGKLIMDQGHTAKKIDYKGGQYAVVIESDAWIGANVIILSGAFVGEGAIIGAGSVVTGVIPPRSIAAGCPARVIASRGQISEAALG